MTVRRRIEIVVGIAVLMAIAIGGYPYIAVFAKCGFEDLKEHLNRIAFDSAKWKQGNENEIRIRMVDSLLRHHKLMAMTRVDVVELLGEPDKTGYFRHYDMVYRLGNERGFIGIDSEWLVMKLNTEKIVVECRIVID